MSADGHVSVIMIFLNAERFLEEAVESVLAQTYERWELLLVDDGSNDRSTEMAQNYAARHPAKIRYLEHDGHENRGMSATRNLGLLHVQGEFVAFLDADDVWLPQKLERHVALLRQHPSAAMLYGTTHMWYGWTGTADDSARDYLRRLGVRPSTLAKPPMLLTLALQRRVETPATCSVLIRRTALERVGGFEEAFRGMYEDQVFFAKLFLTVPVLVASGCWSRYRQHPGSHCYSAQEAGDYDPEMPHPARLRFLQWLNAYLRQRDVSDATLEKLIRRELWLYRHPALHGLLRRSQVLYGSIKEFFLEDATAFLFGVGRRVLPVSFRQWLWARWQRQQKISTP